MSKGAAFSGRLEFLSLGELLQIIGNNGATGVLRIMSKYAQGPGSIYVDKGDVVDAINGDKAGLEALFLLFGWTEGEFSFTQEKIDKKNVINKNRMEIILDGARMVDDGKLSKEDGQSMLQDFLAHTESKKDDMEERVKDFLEKTFERFNFVPRTEYEKLELRLAQLEAKVEGLDKTAAKPAKAVVKRTVKKIEP